MDLHLTPDQLATIQQRYPGRVPVFVLRARNASPDLPVLSKAKFMVPRSLTVGQFVYVVRKHMTLAPEKALFLFIGDSLPTTGTLMSEVYERFKSADGALRVTYTSESSFGAVFPPEFLIQAALVEDQ